MDALKVYIVDTHDESFAENREALSRMLSPYRRAKLERFVSGGPEGAAARRSNNYDLCLAAGLVTDIGLKDYGLREKDMKYGTAAGGKPIFLNHPEIRFNISHAGHYAVAAFSDEYEPGIDIEDCRRISNRIIFSIFGEEERKLIMEAPDEETRMRMFGRIWTVREAFVKATGLGLATPRDSYSTVMKDGRLAISQRVCEGDFGTRELSPIGDYCISVVAGKNIHFERQARG